MESSLEAPDKKCSTVYNRVGKFGFIYRRVTEKDDESKMHDVGYDPVCQTKRPRYHTDLPEGQNNLSNCELSSDQIPDVSIEGDVDKALIEREVELKKFISELRKICTTHRSTENASDIDSSLEMLANEYKKNGLILRYFEANDPVNPHPMTKDIKSQIEFNRATIEQYEHEMKGWTEAMDKKKLSVGHTRRAFELERDIDFSQLHCDDIETLKPYLLPVQSKILAQPMMANPGFREEATERLDAINFKLDAELKRLQSHCHHINSRLKWSNNLDASSVEETPRTLFRALRNHV